MELDPNQVSNPTSVVQQQQRDSSRQTRSNTRAAKQPTPKEESNSNNQQRTGSLRRTRSTAQLDQLQHSESKDDPSQTQARPSKKSRKATITTTASLSINEPPKDSKGKKRADNPDSDPEPAPYSLRPRKPTASASTTTTTTIMPKKSSRLSTSSSKGKSSAAAAAAKTAKAKASATSSTARLEDEDVDMMDVDGRSDDDDDDDDEDDDDDNDGGHGKNDHDYNEDEEDIPAPTSGVNGGGGGGGGGNAAGTNAGTNPSFDPGVALAFFGDYRSVGSYLVTLSNRLKSILNNIKLTADPTTRLVALQELSELLSISTEDTLSGYFQLDLFVKELVKVMGGKGDVIHDDDDDDDEDGAGAGAGADDDAALAISSGGAGGFAGDENMEAQVLACRCLANLMEAMPGSAHTVVYHGAVPVLCSKLLEISYIDLAEQTLSTLEKISEEYPSAIVREGGLAALLNYLDFFSTTVQRTALQAASNCCRNVSPDNFTMIRDVFPILRNVLGYSDQRLVEYACLCIIRIIESYHRTSAGLLESLIDADLIRAVHALLLPAGGSPLVSSNTYTLFLRALGTATKASAKISIALLEADVVDILYQILTGVLPPQNSQDHSAEGGAEGGQGFGGGLADMAVMETLAHRSKDQVEEALSLISELMPPLPKDGVFDSKGYTEKSLSRLIKAKAKAERAQQRASASASVASSAAPSKAPTPVPPEESGSIMDATAYHTRAYEAMTMETNEQNAAGSAAKEKDTPMTRVELLKAKLPLVAKFTRLLVPVLVDVYAASVASHVRTKTLTGLLKAVSFLEGEDLKNALKFVPIASFAGSILSTRDHSTLVLSALQLVELLLAKMPSEYKPAFRREGVLHEIEGIADQKLSSTKSTGESTASSSADAAEGHPIPSKRSSSSSYLTTDPQDAVVLRARVIRAKYLNALASSSSSVEAEDAVFAKLRTLVLRISDPGSKEETLRQSLWEISELFSSSSSSVSGSVSGSETSVSSFEVLQSGLVDGLLELATVKERAVSLERRKQLLYDVFIDPSSTGNRTTAFATFIKKLQESLTRMESFEVVTVSQDSKRSSASMLARQLRLRLIAADDSDIPRNCSNIIVSIHAIATFQALNDYLRPRVSGLLGSLGGGGSSRLSGMLAALAASGIGPGARLAGLAQASTSQEISGTTINPGAGAGAGGASASASSAAGVQTARRRSSRLSAKAGNTTATASEQLPPPPAAAAAAPLHLEPSLADVMGISDHPRSETAVNEDDDLHGDFADDFDAEVFEDDVEPDTSITETTVTLNVADDGSKVEAQTPDGTRIGTPSKDLNAKPSSSKPTSSYAAALKAKPTDWHLEFSMDDHALPLDLTIYGAVYQHESRKAAGSTLNTSSLWNGVYTVKFRKVAGLPPLSDGDNLTKDRSSSPQLSSVRLDAAHSKILRLMRVLYKLNERGTGRSRHALGDSSFINNKLTAKLTRQLEEPMIVASSCLPDWALELPQHFPFLFPFSTRYAFLQSTSFGYARLILKWQSQQTRTNDSSSRRDDAFGFLGRLQRQKVRVSRKHILESAVKVFELYGSSSSVLEVEYFEEVGTGLGPTLEFYSLVSREFARRDLKIWRDADSTMPGLYVHHPQGLFPAPLSNDAGHEREQKRIHLFQVIGQFIGKALLDSRIIDMSCNKIFMKLVLEEDVPQTIATLRAVDPDLANSLTKLQSYVDTVRVMDSPVSYSPDPKKQMIIKSVRLDIDDLALDFTLPGYDIELKPGGRDISVTADNVDEYIAAVIDAIIGKGIAAQVKAFRDGFSKVFPVDDLKIFSADELMIMFGNAEEDWSMETVSEALKADHGFNVESRAIRDLVELMASFDQNVRRDYLQFITGSPKLPIGGFRGLNPPLTVVRKPHEAPLAADDYLPSVMTCANYLKLPEYSSKAVMAEKLGTAMKEGVGSFHLS